jgi:hypothetical protein
MGIFGDIGKIIIGGLIGGPAGAIAVITVEHGDKVVEGTVDVARQIVKIGKDVYRAIPPEAFALAGDPIHGLLKHEFEDEIILLGEIAGEIAITMGLYWPALGPVGASLAIAEGAVPLYVTAGSIIGKLDHRLMNDQEWEMARYIFRDSLYNRDDIILTNLAGRGGRPFVLPGTFGSVFVNLGNTYVHNATTPCGPVLLHELTHVWQAKQKVLKEIFFYEALPAVLKDEYEFTPGDQWDKYGTEQQASIVEAWALGATEKQPHHRGTSCGQRTNFNVGARSKFTINSPLFRYINGNLRRSDDGARTGSGRSVRQLLSDGGHTTMKDMHSAPPPIWWH